MGLAASAFAATSIVFLICKGSFYWLGGRVAEPLAWVANFTMWYWPFVRVGLARGRLRLCDGRRKRAGAASSARRH
jgi:hypothetical protein